MEMNPIGIVHSPVKEPEKMPQHGVAAEVEVYPEFAGGLLGIEGNSHIVVIGFFHQASRELLRTDRLSRGAPERGVFGIRSSSRPNPLGLTPTRLLRREGNMLYVERLDFIEGTPVMDIKRYSPGWDCIFSARSSRDLSPLPERSPKYLADDMLVEAVHFHGERCLGTALAVRIMRHAMETWQISQKDPEMKLSLGEDGCIADGLQALSGAALGNGRLKVPGGRTYRLIYRDKSLAFYPKEVAGLGPQQALEADLEELFSVRDDVPTHAAYVAEKAALVREVDPVLLKRVTESLVHGKLPCAVAFQIAKDMGVHVSQVGRAADLASAKIALCQLGCFR
ncbi:MAG: tRNA (N6-threonylcarbamoyladenosine(37)-N6)-methyltransferase TrmO [Dehalococcoidia bacterium]|nr:tRNA (N6-threonylcarbamoyladenosine(37)-N6)-methyltransferase TrmO [Dehalococcoidia bacterium]